MPDEAVIAQIFQAVGRCVSFQYPGNEGCKEGLLKDRALLASPATTGVLYWDVVDLIEFHGEAEPEWIQIGYYRKPGARLVWGARRRFPSRCPSGNGFSFMPRGKSLGSGSYSKKSWRNYAKQVSRVLERTRRLQRVRGLWR